MTIPTTAAPFAGCRDELDLIERVLKDQKYNYGLVPWIIEDPVDQLQITRYPIRYHNQYPAIVVTPEPTTWRNFGAQGEENKDEDMYDFPVTFSIVIPIDMEITYNGRRYQDADKSVLVVRDVLLQIFRTLGEFYDPDIPDDEPQFGWTHVSPMSSKYLVSRDMERDNTVTLELTMSFLFQREVAVLPNMEEDYDPWGNEE